MPRVTEEYRAARRRQIVVAAANLFSSNGFHATSMADVISASQLSAGAVYRYFRSKEELIGAVSELALETADEIFGRLLDDERAAPSPGEVIETVVRTLTNRNEVIGVDLPRMALQVWAEAIRSPELAERAHLAFSGLKARHVEAARRWQAAGNLPADADLEQVGSAMLGLTQGFLVQNLLVRGTSADGYVAGVHALLGSKSN
ncbi:TetR/AcrR family transcriptional regulator [Kineosporia rhizophila]|uniref:TetR/AcrR family transcriptional regulator n=1 Tax=Kineosporia TaxID=49184 RepID=UPI001E31609F|nr:MULTISPECIES: TetR/AcrR family transcriptional regulator [Kineosporia]MCE0540385.1 TetR/AcrR family transcriptional regulator [Kineosporia rhizophila]GLY16639.1 hypothetical protein Kisp01_36540 [Kineosporia sp. NBRC 101677]